MGFVGNRPFLLAFASIFHKCEFIQSPKSNRLFPEAIGPVIISSSAPLTFIVMFIRITPSLFVGPSDIPL